MRVYRWRFQPKSTNMPLAFMAYGSAPRTGAHFSLFLSLSQVCPQAVDRPRQVQVRKLHRPCTLPTAIAVHRHSHYPLILTRAPLLTVIVTFASQGSLAPRPLQSHSSSDTPCDNSRTSRHQWRVEVEAGMKFSSSTLTPTDPTPMSAQSSTH